MILIARPRIAPGVNHHGTLVLQVLQGGHRFTSACQRHLDALGRLWQPQNKVESLL